MLRWPHANPVTVMVMMMMIVITDTTHRDLWPRPTCRGRHTHPPTDPDLQVNSMCLLRPNLPDRLRPTCPNSRACQPDCCWEGGAKWGAREEKRNERGRQGASSFGTIKMFPGMAFWHPRGTKHVDFSTAGPMVPCKRLRILSISHDKNVAFSTAGPMVACNRYTKQRKSRCETYGRANGCM